MKKFIWTMVFAVAVAIYMVVDLSQEHKAQIAAQQAATPPTASHWRGPQQADMRPTLEESQSVDRAAVMSSMLPDDELDERRADDDNAYVAPQPSRLAEVEALRDSTGRNVVNLALVPYQLEFEPVDHQWFREMEDALYRVSYSALEPLGIRFVNLRCATSVCTVDLDAPAGAEISSHSLVLAMRDIDALGIDTLASEQVSMVFITRGSETIEQIIFQRKE